MTDFFGCTVVCCDIEEFVFGNNHWHYFTRVRLVVDFRLEVPFIIGISKSFDKAYFFVMVVVFIMRLMVSYFTVLIE